MNYISRFPGMILSLLISCFISLSLFAVAANTVPAVEPPEELLIGIEPEHNIFDQVERYRHLADYVSQKLGVKIKITIMSRYGEVLKRFRTLRLDGAFLTAYTATMGINQLHLVPLVNPVNLTGETTSRGYIFVRKDSQIRNFMEMKGGSIVFVDPATLEGYLFPLFFLKQQGIDDINRFFSRYYFSGSNASAIYAVLDGRADIGAARSTVFHQLVKSDPSIGPELQIIAQSPAVPEITLCIKSEISQSLQEKLTNILLDMDKTPEGRKVLEFIMAHGFVRSNREDFSPIENMAREALGTLTVHGN